MSDKTTCINVSLNVGNGKGYSVKEVVDKANEILHNGEMIVRVSEIGRAHV